MANGLRPSLIKEVCPRVDGSPGSVYSPTHRQTVDEGAVTRMAAETPTIVLVHGAWADASGFDAEIRARLDRIAATLYRLAT